MARPNQIDSVLLDASALLGVVKGEPEFLCLQSLLAAIEQGSVKLVESTAILTEVLSRHAKDTAKHQLARRSIRALLEAPATELVDVSTVVARKAGMLRTDHGLHTWDAIHLATAIVAEVDVLIVRDSRFPFGDLEGVHISPPFDIDDDKLV